MMKKYFSSILCRNGYMTAFNTIYKKDYTSRVFLIGNGDDFERTVFFERLINNLRGYNITLFSPFYDDGTDGIYIENINTYILSDGGYNRISPILPGVWEKTVPVVNDKAYSYDIIRQVLNLKARENNYYKNACEQLKIASGVREKLHSQIPLNDDKLINYINRFCSRFLRNSDTTGKVTIRMLSSITPLGVHTHYDTLFDNMKYTFEFNDKCGFVGSVFLGVVKDYAVRKKIPFIMSPAYFSSDIPQILTLPTADLNIILTDDNHKLPFEPTERITSARFVNDDGLLDDERIETLLAIENQLIDKAVLSVYEGRDCRFQYNNLTNGYSNEDEAKTNADKLCERLMI